MSCSCGRESRPYYEGACSLECALEAYTPPASWGDQDPSRLVFDLAFPVRLPPNCVLCFTPTGPDELGKLTTSDSRDEGEVERTRLYSVPVPMCPPCVRREDGASLVGLGFALLGLSGLLPGAIGLLGWLKGTMKSWDWYLTYCLPPSGLFVLLIIYGLAKARTAGGAETRQSASVSPRTPGSLGERLYLHLPNEAYCALAAKLNPGLSYAIARTGELFEAPVLGDPEPERDWDDWLFLRRYHFIVGGGAVGALLLAALSWVDDSAASLGVPATLGFFIGAVLGWAGVTYARFRFVQRENERA